MSSSVRIKSTAKSDRGVYVSVTDYGDIDEKTEYDTEKHIARSQTSPPNVTLYKSMTHVDHSHHKFYKPTSNRSWCLSIFLLAIAICILLLELAVRDHPDARDVPKLGPRVSAVRRTVVWVRQEDTTGGTVTSTAETTTNSITTSDPVTTTDPVVTSALSDEEITTHTVGQPLSGDQITLTSTVIASSAPANDELAITTQPTETSTSLITADASGTGGDELVIASATTTNGGGELVVTTSAPVTKSEMAPADDELTVTSQTSSAPAPGEPNPADQITVTTSDVTGAPAPVDQITITSSAGVTSTQPTSGSQPSVTSPTSTISSPEQDKQASATSTTAQPVTLAGVASVVSGSLIVSGSSVVGTAPQVAAASVVSGSLIVSGTSIIATVDQNNVQGTSAGAVAVGHVTLTDAAGSPTATVAYTGNAVYTDANGIKQTISYNGDIVLTNSEGIATKTLLDAIIMTDSNGVATKTLSHNSDIVLTDSRGVATKTLSNAIIMTDSNGVATGTLSYADAVTLTDSNGVATKTVLFTGLATQAAAAGSSSTSAPDKGYTFTKFSYFQAIYLPRVLAVLLASAWLVVFMSFKLMEPFYRLATAGGAPAESTLLADYLSSGLSVSSLSHAAEGNWVLVLAGLVQLVLAIIMIFITSTMNVVPTAYCKTEISDQQPCNPRWVIDIQSIRIVEICLVACFSMIIMIIVLNHGRVSGVYSDPSKISTVADILVHKPLIHEIRDIPAEARQKDVALDLRQNRYMLGTFFENGQEHYGIVKLNTDLDHLQKFKQEAWYKSAYRHVGAYVEGIVESTHRSLPFLPDFVCMALAIILAAIVLAYYSIDGKHGGNAFNDWMNSTGRGPGILLSVLGVTLGFLVKRKERFFRLSHSYAVLGRGPTLATDAVTTSQHSTPFDSIYHAARKGNYTLVLLAFAAILADIILMMAPSIPYRGAQTKEVYRISTFMVLISTSIILLIVANVTWKEWSQQEYRASDCPETLAAVLIRLCASRFVDEKNTMRIGPYQYGHSGDHDEMQKVRYGGVDGKRKYTYGVMPGLDGVQRLMVEEDVHATPHVIQT